MWALHSRSIAAPLPGSLTAVGSGHYGRNRYLVYKRGVVDTDSTTVDADGPQRLALLASALAGRTVAVAAGPAGEPAWTDGITVFVDADQPPARQLESVTVQASLLAGGGLAPDRDRPGERAAHRAGDPGQQPPELRRLAGDPDRRAPQGGVDVLDETDREHGAALELFENRADPGGKAS